MEPRERFVLNEQRHGIVGELVLSTDSRFGKLKSSGHHNPYVFSSQTLATANAQAQLLLQDKDGRAIDEVTLFPAIHLWQQDLGDGTDSFFAEQMLTCLAGSFCGPMTRVFQVRDGRLRQVSAAGSDGSQRLMEMHASQRTRWALLSHACGTSTTGIIHQYESGESAIPELWQTRFCFRNGKWWYAQQRVADIEPLGVAPLTWDGDVWSFRLLDDDTRTDEELFKALKSDGLIKCFDLAPPPPSTMVSVRMTVTVNAAGRVTQVSDRGSYYDKPPVLACMRRRIRSTSFPRGTNDARISAQLWSRP